METAYRSRKKCIDGKSTQHKKGQEDAQMTNHPSNRMLAATLCCSLGATSPMALGQAEALPPYGPGPMGGPAGMQVPSMMPGPEATAEPETIAGNVSGSPGDTQQREPGNMGGPGGPGMLGAPDPWDQGPERMGGPGMIGPGMMGGPGGPGMMGGPGGPA